MVSPKRNASTRFVRGGQSTQHWWRMAAQVGNYSMLVAIGVFTVVYTGLVVWYYDVDLLRETWAIYMADWQVETFHRPMHRITYVDQNGFLRDRFALAIHDDPVMRALLEDYRAMATRFIYIAAIPALIVLVIAIILFARVGERLGENEHVRGSRLVTAKELAAWTRRKWKAYERKFGKSNKAGPRYTIAGIEFPPNAVEAQTGIFGTVGVGKTNTMKELLGTIRAKGGRAIIYDKMGALLRDYYDPETDVILNPFDGRSVAWSPFFEAEDAAAFAQIAEVMIPQRTGANDPFWSQTARLVFEYSARSLLKSGQTTNAALRSAIMGVSAEELEALIQGTPGAHFFGKHIEKTSASIRANMIAELRFLEFLRDDGTAPFSIRRWVKDPDKSPGFVFLTGDAEHSVATRNIISTVFEVAANALMTCPETRDPSIWFFLDEVPTLNRLPFLTAKLAEIRQFGGAFVLGYQVYSQLEEIYGDKGAQSIAGTLNNRVVFNTPDARTAKLFSESLGFEDLIEHRENLTIGAHVTRDGVGFASQRIERAIVTASEIQALPQFEAYIRFAYDAPTARVTFAPIPTEAKAEKFVAYAGAGFAEGSMDPATPLPSLASSALRDDVRAEMGFAAWPAARQLEAFEEWYAKGDEVDLLATLRGVETIAPVRDRDVLWEHYYRSRIAGDDIPTPIPSPTPGVLMGSSPSQLPNATQRVPTLDELRRRIEAGTGQDLLLPAPPPPTSIMGLADKAGGSL